MPVEDIVQNVRVDTFMEELFERPVFIAERAIGGSSVNFHTYYKITEQYFRITEYVKPLTDEELDKRLDAIMERSQ